MSRFPGMLPALSKIISTQRAPAAHTEAQRDGLAERFDLGKGSPMPAIGCAYRETYHDLLLADRTIDAAEITFEHADNPLRSDACSRIAKDRYISVHALKLSPGSADPPMLRYLDAVRDLAVEHGAAAVSDHLAFTRASQVGAELGHFAPIPFTLGAVENVCRNIDFIQQRLAPLRFYVENIAYLFRFEGEMSEAEFTSRVLSRTGCGWLLDVTNVYANAMNFGFDPYDFIARVMPDAASVQMHLSGGCFDPALNAYIDSHSHTVPQQVWELYQFAIEQAGGKVEAVFIERDQDMRVGDLQAEIQVARAIARSCEAVPAHELPSRISPELQRAC